MNIYNNYHFVTINNLPDVTVTNELSINLPFLHDSTLKFVTNYASTSDPNNQYWIGSVDWDHDTFNFVHADISIVKTNGVWRGNIRINGIKNYDIFDLGYGQQLIAVSDYSLTRYDNLVTCEDHGGPIGPVTVFSDVESGDNCLRSKTKVLFLYTDQVSANHNSVVAQANLCLQQNNHIWYNSEIFNYLELAGVEKVNFPLSNSISYDVNELSTNSIISSLRDAYNADIVVMFYPAGHNGSYGGWAKKIAEYVAQKDNAFAIVDIQEATGKDRSFTHEIGHIYGGRHQTEEDSDPSDYNAHAFLPSKNLFPILMNKNRKNNTIIYKKMTNDLLYSTVEYISNPDVTKNGVKTGKINKNNALIINKNRYYVAGFYNDVADPYVTIKMQNFDCDAN